jgi:4-carboxymuconolactone decarboxylase
MAPRIPPLPPTGNADDVQALIADSTVSVGADNLMLTLANHPGLMRKWLPFGGKLLFGGKLPGRDRELIILRAAWQCQSDYEWGQHRIIGRDAGLTDEEIDRVAKGADDPAWSAEDALVLRATDQALADHRLDEVTYSALAARYDVRQIMEVLFVAGHYAMLACFLNTAGVERDPGVDGFPA